MNYKIDNLQYCKWSREVFEINREAGLDAVHVTVVYHEDFDEFNSRVNEWNTYFKENSDLIFLGKSYKDIEKAKTEKKTAQNLKSEATSSALAKRLAQVGDMQTPPKQNVEVETVQPEIKTFDDFTTDLLDKLHLTEVKTNVGEEDLEEDFDEDGPNQYVSKDGDTLCVDKDHQQLQFQEKDGGKVNIDMQEENNIKLTSTSKDPKDDIGAISKTIAGMESPSVHIKNGEPEAAILLAKQLVTQGITPTFSEMSKKASTRPLALIPT